MTIKFKTKLVQWQGKGGWYYVYIPKSYYPELKSISETSPKRGFGALKVAAQVGSSAWQSSIFPDNKAAQYILFVKKEIRTRENLKPGDSLAVSVRLIDI